MAEELAARGWKMVTEMTKRRELLNFLCASFAISRDPPPHPVISN
jgi:hypothetical protein